MATFFTTYFEYVLEELLRSVFDSIWLHFGSVFRPISLSKTKNNAEGVVEYSVFEILFQTRFRSRPEAVWEPFLEPKWIHFEG